MMQLSRFALLLALLGGSGVAAAQQMPGTTRPAAPAPAAPAPAPTRLCATISGHVLGNGQPLAGATVTVEGTRLVTITNGEGFFTLNIDQVQHPKLQFSAAGYEPQAVPLTSCNTFDVELPLLPGTRIKQRGKKKGFIMKTGSQQAAPAEN